MYVEQYGDGPEIYLAFHGWGGDHREFAPLAARLSPEAALHSVDLPGYGRSPRPREESLTAVANEVREYASGLGQSITLIGFCSGAVIAMMVARAEPARYKRMVLIDPFAYLPWYFRIFTAGEFGRRAYQTTFASAVGRRLTNWILRKKQTQDADFMAAFSRVDHAVTHRYLEWFARFGSLEPYRVLSLPIDIAVGEHTFAAVRKSVCDFCALWPHARTQPLRHVGHLPMVKGAGQLAELIFGVPAFRRARLSVSEKKARSS